MKFGKQLNESAHPAYRNYYIAYSDLKQAIKIITGEQALVDDDESLAVSSPLISQTIRRRRGRTAEAQFQDLIDHELNKVNNFSTVQYLALEEEIRSVLRATPISPQSIESLQSSIIAFEEYIRLNYTGFRKAAKKFDKCNQSNSSSWFMGRVARSGFMSVNIDKLVLGIDLLVLVARGVGSSVVPAIAAGLIPLFEQHSDQFRRLKYFLRADQLVGVEMALLKDGMHALIGFPTRQGFEQLNTIDKLVNGVTNPLVRPPPGGSPRLSFSEWAVVFERPDRSYSQYACRRNKKIDPNGPCGYAEAVFSIRWNEFQHRQGRCSLVKESHPRWQPEGQAAVLQIELPQKQISDLVAGKSSSTWHPLVSEFAAFIASGQQPSSIYSYNRILFEQPDKLFFVAIDQDVRFGSLRSVDGGIGFVFAKIDSVEYHTFLRQRAMTIWVGGRSTQLPSYLQSIVGNPAVTEVASFSKSVHAEAALHVVTEVDRPVTAGLPHWFVYTLSEDAAAGFALPSVDESTQFRSTASPRSVGNFDVLPASGKLVLQDYVKRDESTPVITSPVLPPAPPNDNDLSEPLLDRSASDRRNESSKSLWEQFKFVFFGSVQPVSIPDPSSKIEPKTFLANERTFLNWSYCSFVISALALTLKAVDERAAAEAAILTIVAIATLAWALNVYRLRISALRAMKPLDALLVSSTNGASLVGLSVASALGFMWICRVYDAFYSDSELIEDI
jgi:uncharacterized membrane protein YidH (DUF202 family)